MKDPELDREKEEKAHRALPLIIEIMPGQAAEGLVDIYEPGTYEEKSLRKLCEETLEKKDWSIEERQVLEDVQRQLEGGKLLSGGAGIDRAAVDYAVYDVTEKGEDYLYVPVRAIKPQEGGS